MARERREFENLDYYYQYGKDLENRRDKIEGHIAARNRIFCADCKKYYIQGKRIVNKNGCKGSDMEWAVCPYRKIAIEVIKYG